MRAEGLRRRIERRLNHALEATGHGPALRNLIREFLRFAVVGGVAVAIHYTVLILLVEVGRAPVLLATSVGYVCGAVFSYTFNRLVTFEHSPGFHRGLILYVTLGTSGLLLNGMLVVGLSRLGAPYQVAQVMATGVVTCWNFLVAKFGVFRGRKDPPTSAERA